MGNCLVCFKEPSQPAQINVHCHREEMPEAPLYSSQQHNIPQATTTAVPDTALMSNGNHLPCIETVAPLGRFYQKRQNKLSLTNMGNSDSKVSDGKLSVLFENYKDKEEDCILEEGIEQLCKDLAVSPDEFKVLVLAWKLNAEQMCQFTRAEFVNGLRNVRVDSIKSLQNRLPELVQEVEHNDEAFKNLYRFTFKFGLDAASGERSLPTETAIVLWRLVFTVRKPPILDRWINFLKKHEQYRGIPKDTWNMFLNFCDTVGDDLSSYDDNEAWPSVFDDFVEYENDQANQNVAKECENLMIGKHD